MRNNQVAKPLNGFQVFAVSVLAALIGGGTAYWLLFQPC